jgi:hypothetical protein
MNFDQLIICDKCQGDACYVEQVNENISTYMCFSCGFQTNSLMKEGEDFYKEQIEILPELYKDLFHTDKDGKIWMPSAVNIPDQGMVFANGSGVTSWSWSAVKAVLVKEEEKSKYPIPHQPGKFYEYRMDMSTMKNFPEHEYIEALTYIGVLPE